MENIQDFADQRQKSWCIHCGKWINTVETNRDHVPTKGLLQRPLPANVSVVEICMPCNSSFSVDEEYTIAFLGCVLTGTTDPDAQVVDQAKVILTGNRKLQNEIELSRTVQSMDNGEVQAIWEPDQDRVRNVLLKNARGHAYFEIGEPMLSEPTYIWFGPLITMSAEELANFETIDWGGRWPEVGSRMMDRMATGRDLKDGWVVVQAGVYRYSVVQDGGMLVRMVLYEYLAVEIYWE